MQGIDVNKMIELYKSKVMREMKVKWIGHLPTFIKKVLKHGHI